MKKYELLNKMEEEKVIVVIRGNSVDDAEKTADACVKGGINILEITYTNAYASQIINKLREKYKDNNNVVIGAGTVIDAETARVAILNGAQFIVCPNLDERVIKLCNTYSIPVMPAVFTPTEVKTALSLGVDVVKLFPADVFKPNGLKALKAPFPNAEFMPTGGVSLDNIEEWLKAGAFTLGAGSFITKGAESGDYTAVESRARELVNKINKYKDGIN